MMLNCYLELKPFFDMNHIDIIPYLPRKGDDYRLKSLLEELEKLESISKKLQEEPGVDLADARALFDDISKFHPELNYYLKNEVGESICKFVDFENAVVGTILNEQLTEAQNQTLTRFRDNGIVEVSNTSSSNADTIISSNKRRKTGNVNLSWIPSTSNNAERLFSKAKRVMGDHRQKLNPVNFESQIFLIANKKYWSVCDVQSII